MRGMQPPKSLCGFWGVIKEHVEFGYGLLYNRCDEEYLEENWGAVAQQHRHHQPAVFTRGKMALLFIRAFNDLWSIFWYKMANRVKLVIRYGL